MRIDLPQAESEISQEEADGELLSFKESRFN